MNSEKIHQLVVILQIISNILNLKQPSLDTNVFFHKRTKAILISKSFGNEHTYSVPDQRFKFMKVEDIDLCLIDIYLIIFVFH